MPNKICKHQRLALLSIPLPCPLSLPPLPIECHLPAPPGTDSQGLTEILHKILPRTHQQIPVSLGPLQGHGNLSIIKKCVSVIEFVVMGLYGPIWQQSTFQSPEKDEIEDVLLTVDGASLRKPLCAT